MITSRFGLAFIQAMEGLRLQAYQDAAGVWTIGYGHTGAVGNKPLGPGVRITESEAEELLVGDLAVFESRMVTLLRRPATQDQWDALVSLAYNIGLGNLRSSTVLRRFNAGAVQEAADAFLLWTKVRRGNRLESLAGLERRRRAERALFLGDYRSLEEVLRGWKPALARRVSELDRVARSRPVAVV